MKRSLIGALALMAVACASAPVGARGARTQLRPFAEPSKVIAAEIAFNQLAQEKGQWTAFRDTAADEAVMFVPARVEAHAWLKGRANPPVAVEWQPYAVWMSCDGSYAVTRGAWQRPGSTGFFTTVWQRQGKDGSYKWVLDLGDTLAQPLEPPEMIAGNVAECPARPPGPTGERRDRGSHRTPPLADPAAAQSEDATLRWKADLDTHGAGSLVVETRAEAGYQEVLRETFAARN